MAKRYSRVNWAGYPAKTTPISADNLNKMDKGINDLDDAVVAMENNVTNQGKQVTKNQEDIGALNESLTASDSLTFRFATDGAGNYGYLKADDSFVPFKSGTEQFSFSFSADAYIAYTLNTKNYSKFKLTGGAANLWYINKDGTRYDYSPSDFNKEISIKNNDSITVHGQWKGGVGMVLYN